MRIIAIVIAAFAAGGCVETDCGPMPQVPDWSVSVFTKYGGGEIAEMPAEQWRAHKAWRDAVTAWAACVRPTDGHTSP